MICCAVGILGVTVRKMEGTDCEVETVTLSAKGRT